MFFRDCVIIDIRNYKLDKSETRGNSPLLSIPSPHSPKEKKNINYTTIILILIIMIMM